MRPVILFLFLASLVGAQSPSAERFENEVRPLLAGNCYSCHSEKAGKKKGGLLLDSFEGIRKGGRSGPLYSAGKPDESLLWQVLTHEHEMRMPPKQKLGAGAIASVRLWIAEGAELPAQLAATGEAMHWAFQPRRPVVAEDGALATIDDLLDAAQERRNVEASPRADPGTLLRRVTWRLTGLPPTRDELAKFLADPDQTAFTSVVDRLLASPRYAEQMARHWLDLARYADSNGADENHCMSQAWRYRDWVVQAFAKDLSYDQFLMQQIAGDLLPEKDSAADTIDQHIATGFLVLGPKMLAEQDKEKLKYDLVDEQMDVLFRTALGFSTSCARCHDHKFDPVTQEDYYALAGVFASTKSLSHTNFVSQWMERDVGPRARVLELTAWRGAAAEAAKKEKHAMEAADLEARRLLASRFADHLLAAEKTRAAVLTLEAEHASNGNLIADRSMWGDARTVVARTGSSGLQFAEFRFERAGRFELELRAAAEESRPVRVLLDGREIAAAALGAVTGSWLPLGQRWSSLGEVELAAGEHVLRMERDGSFPHVDKLRLVPKIDERAAWPALTPEGLESVALRAAVDALEVAAEVKEAPLSLWVGWRAQPEAVLAEAHAASKNPLAVALAAPAPRDAMEFAGRLQTLGLAAMQRAEPAQFGFDAKRDAALGLVAGPEGLFWLQAGELESLWPETRRATVLAERLEVKAVQGRRPEALPVGMVVEALPRKPLPVLARGNHLTPDGEAQPLGAPAALSGLVPSGPFAAAEDGRLALARWMIDARHPLTARVMVNRVWLWLFGEGLVRTPSDFGSKGDRPELPELLDTLAERFVRCGWSVRQLVREIVLTEAWQRSALPTENAFATDPENATFAHMRPFRLAAEEVRDGLLLTSGVLDVKPFGRSLALESGVIVTNDQSGNLANYDSLRRSLWLPVVRNAMYEMFSIFDYVDANGPLDRRGQSVQPQQMLFFLNSAMVREAAAKLAEASLAAAATDSAREDFIALGILHRRPLDSERLTLAGLRARVRAEGRDEKAAWAAVAQVLFASNEWLHVD